MVVEATSPDRVLLSFPAAAGPSMEKKQYFRFQSDPGMRRCSIRGGNLARSAVKLRVAQILNIRACMCLTLLRQIATTLFRFTAKFFPDDWPRQTVTGGIVLLLGTT